MFKRIYNFLNGRPDSQCKAMLDNAVADWRSAEQGAEPESLSRGTRARILDAALAGSAGESARPAPLFVPMRRLALGAGFPALLLTVLCGYVVVEKTRIVPPSTPQAAEPFLQIERNGEDAIVRFAGLGAGEYQVSKATDPARPFHPVATVTGADAYVRDASVGCNLVFYRVD